MMNVSKVVIAAMAGAVAGTLLEAPIRRVWNATGAKALGMIGVDAALSVSGPDPDVKYPQPPEKEDGKEGKSL